MIAAYREPDRRRGPRADGKLIDSLSHGVPAALTELITLGRTLKQARRRRAGLLRPARHQQRTDRGDQRPTRTPPRLRPRLPQPHQLHRPITARDRRLQTPTTPSIVKSRETAPARSSRRHRSPRLAAPSAAGGRPRPPAATGRSEWTCESWWVRCIQRAGAGVGSANTVGHMACASSVNAVARRCGGGTSVASS